MSDTVKWTYTCCWTDHSKGCPTKLLRERHPNWHERFKEGDHDYGGPGLKYYGELRDAIDKELGYK